MNVSRKNFLKLFGTGVFAATGLSKLGHLSSQTLTANGRTLINLILDGGPDFRHLFVPVPNSEKQSYGYKYWNNRVTAIGRGSAADNYNVWKSIYDRDYEQVTLSGTTFGIMKANTTENRPSYNGWLIEKIKAGKVAIVNNVYHSISRDHPHSLLVLQSGIYETAAGTTNMGGWGGRLIDEINGGSGSTSSASKVISFSGQIKPFCNTTNKNRILSFTNSRGFGLRQPTLSNNGFVQTGTSSRSRALASYYNALHTEGTVQGTVFKKFLDQQLKLNGLTKNIQDRLPSGNTYEDAINNLINGGSRLRSQYFANQIKNLYDAFQVSDLLGMRIASLHYSNWDSHKFQVRDIEPQFDDMFGTDKGFDALFKNRSTLFDNSVIVIAGDFGRQLKSNGDNGTDHGRGNSVLVIGGAVKGGVYGEMFPTRESQENAGGVSLFDVYNRDIEGRTAFHKVFGPVCDWVSGSAGTGDRVFSSALPTIKTDVTGDSVLGIEKGVTLSLF
jgi:uncharacterized protein (DUF1501 family)